MVPTRALGESGVKVHLYSGILGEGPFIIRELGNKQNLWGLREQGSEKNILGSWRERSFF